MDPLAPKRKRGRPPTKQPVVSTAVKPQETIDMSTAPNFTDTKEFKDAVASAASKAASEALVHMLAELRADGSIGAKTSAGEGDRTLMAGLADTLAALVNQSSNRKVVPPEVIAQRERAFKRMVTLIMNARAAGERADYRLISKVWLHERLIEPYTKKPEDKVAKPTEIFWTGVPNESMVPLNDLAKDIFSAWREYTGTPEIVQTADNRPAWITSGGLVVKGEPPARRQIGDGRAPDVADFKFDDDLGIRDEVGSPNDPNASRVHVLGTVAKPAQQSGAPPIA